MIAVDPAAREERGVLQNMFELYAYDFSEILDLDLEADGRFPAYPLDAYWTDPERRPFLIRVDERLAGFALIQSKSRLSGATGIWDVAEFCVLRKYRRRGVGSAAAGRIFRAHPGPWEVRERASNVAATAFWRRAITAAGFSFEESVLHDDTWDGPVQRFVSEPWNPSRQAADQNPRP